MIYIYIFLPDEQVVIETFQNRYQYILHFVLPVCVTYTYKKKKNEHTLLSLGANGHTKKKKKKKTTFVDWLNKLYSVICITVVVR